MDIPLLKGKNPFKILSEQNSASFLAFLGRLVTILGYIAVKPTLFRKIERVQLEKVLP